CSRPLQVPRTAGRGPCAAGRDPRGPGSGPYPWVRQRRGTVTVSRLRRVPKRAYLRAAGSAHPGDARERILLAAAVADLRQDLYGQHCLLAALIEALAARGLIDEEDLRRRVLEDAAAGLRVRAREPPAGRPAEPGAGPAFRADSAS